MDLELISKRGLVTGTHGSGKSMFMKNLAKLVNEQEKVPVLIYTSAPTDYYDIQKESKTNFIYVASKGYRHDMDGFEPAAEQIIEFGKRLTQANKKGCFVILDEFSSLYKNKQNFRPNFTTLYANYRKLRIGIVAVCHRTQDIPTAWSANTDYTIFFRQKPSPTTKRAMDGVMEGTYEKVTQLKPKDYGKYVMLDTAMSHEDLIYLDKNNQEVKNDGQRSKETIPGLREQTSSSGGTDREAGKT